MKHFTAKVLRFSFTAIIAFALMTSIASAHVEVTPKTSTPGEEETYTVKVPSEKDVPTIKFVIKIPSGLEFDSFEPVSGWTITTQKGSEDKVKSITYEAAGQGILPDQFQHFSFVAKNPDKAGKASWDAYQYYKDGSIVEWTGDPGSNTPHSITTIISDSGKKQPVAEEAKQNQATQTTSVSTSAGTSGSSLPLIPSLISVILSIVSIFIAVRKK